MHFQSISGSRVPRLAPLLALALLGVAPALAQAQESDSSSALSVRGTTSASTLFSNDSSAASSRLALGQTGVEGRLGFVSPSTSVSLLFARKQAQGAFQAGAGGAGGAGGAAAGAVVGTSLGTTGLVVAGGTLLLGGGVLVAGLSGGLTNGPAPSLVPIPAVPELGTVVGLGGLLVLGALAWRQRRKVAEETEWQV